MSSPADRLREHLPRVKEILASCGAKEPRLIGGGGMGSGGGEVHLLVRMEENRTLADIVPAEEELSRLLDGPVLIIPEQTLHPDQARRLRKESEPL